MRMAMKWAFMVGNTMETSASNTLAIDLDFMIGEIKRIDLCLRRACLLLVRAPLRFDRKDPFAETERIRHLVAINWLYV